MNTLERFRRFSYQYEVIRLLFVFLGAAISIIILQFIVLQIPITGTQIGQDQSVLFQTQTQLSKDSQNTALQQTVTQIQQKISFEQVVIIFSLFLIYIIPVILSIILTKISSERRIVPPLYMQIIIFGYSIIYLSFQNQYVNQAPFFAFMIGFYCFFAGQTQNSIVRRLIGIKAGENEVNRYSLNARAKPQSVENMLLKEKFRTELGLKNDIEETRRGIVLRSLPRMNPQVVIELTEGNNEQETFINVVIFEKGEYEFRKSPRLDERATKYMLYLKDILSRIESGIECEEISNAHAEPLVDQILSENKGISPQVEGITMMGIFKIIMFIGGVISIGYLFTINKSIEAMSVLFFLFMYLAFELPSKISRRYKKS